MYNIHKISKITTTERGYYMRCLWFIETLVVIFFLSLLLGCSIEQEREKIEITLMHGWGDSTSNHIAMRQIYKDFEKANPDITLIFDSSPDLSIVIDKANDKLAANKMPDIISTNGVSNFLTNAMIKDKALNLKPYIDADEQFQADIHPAVFKAWLKDDEIYTLPDALEVIGYWYNEEILRLAGVTEDGSPLSGVKLPETWEQFKLVCEKIERWAEQTNNEISAIHLEDDQNLILLGARMVDETKDRGVSIDKWLYHLSSNELQTTVEDLRVFNQFQKDNKMNRMDILQTFKNGKLAFFIGGVWESDQLSLQENSDVFNYATFPTSEGKSVAYVSASSGYVIGNTGDPKKIEACVRFLKYMLSSEVQQRIVIETKQAPSNPKVDMQWIKASVPMLGNALEIATQADIQIPTLYSLYDEATLEIVKSKIQN